MDETTIRGIRAGIAAYVLWGLLTVYWKQLDAFAPVELIGWRIAFATLVMGAVVTVYGRWPAIRTALGQPRLVVRLAIAAVILTTNWTLYVYAVTSGRIIETALGYFLAPLGTMAIGVLILHERLSPLKWLAVALAATAVIILTVSYGEVPLIAIGIAATWSSYGLAKRQVPLSPVESLTGETLLLFLPALGVIAWFWGRADSVASIAVGSEWLLVLGTGVVTAVPLLLFSVAARSVPFTLLGPLNYLVPIINFLLGWVIYAEPLPILRFLGFALVWGALAAVTADMIRSARSRAPRARLGAFDQGDPDAEKTGRMHGSARAAPVPRRVWRR